MLEGLVLALFLDVACQEQTTALYGMEEVVHQ